MENTELFVTCNSIYVCKANIKYIYICVCVCGCVCIYTKVRKQVLGIIFSKLNYGICYVYRQNNTFYCTLVHSYLTVLVCVIID